MHSLVEWYRGARWTSINYRVCIVHCWRLLSLLLIRSLTQNAHSSTFSLYLHFSAFRSRSPSGLSISFRLAHFSVCSLTVAADNPSWLTVSVHMFFFLFFLILLCVQVSQSARQSAVVFRSFRFPQRIFALCRAHFRPNNSAYIDRYPHTNTHRKTIHGKKVFLPCSNHCFVNEHHKIEKLQSWWTGGFVVSNLVLANFFPIFILYLFICCRCCFLFRCVFSTHSTCAFSIAFMCCLAVLLRQKNMLIFFAFYHVLFPPPVYIDQWYWARCNVINMCALFSLFSLTLGTVSVVFNLVQAVPITTKSRNQQKFKCCVCVIVESDSCIPWFYACFLIV